MIRNLKSIYFLIKRRLNLLHILWKRWKYFIRPNYSKLRLKLIICHKYPLFNQLTLCEGSGIVEIGDMCMFGYKLGGFNSNGTIELQARSKDARVRIGNNVLTNNNIFICAENYISIGDDTLIGQNVVIMDHEAHGTNPTERRKLGEIGNVIIGKNVWIGNSVTILKNTEIGENSIVATGAVVSGKFPANVIIGGVPAKIIKNL